VEGRDILVQAKRDGLSSKQLKDAATELGKLRAQGINPDKVLDNAKGSDKPGHEWPPIITLSDPEDNYFKSGSAELSQKFRNDLNGPILSRILELTKTFDVDIIEVVGHTDERPVGAHLSNLDRDLLSVLTGSTNIASIVASDNAGLGLARAVSVVSVLRRQKSLTPYRILPLSGGQLIDTNETLATSGLPADILQRRRIEIRLRKFTPHDFSVSALPPANAKPQRQKPTPSPARRPVPQAAPLTIFPRR
jgi:outer membrane protein OmpA-like peptidoglycan-associated protein